MYSTMDVASEAIWAGDRSIGVAGSIEGVLSVPSSAVFSRGPSVLSRDIFLCAVTGRYEAIELDKL